MQLNSAMREYRNGNVLKIGALNCHGIKEKVDYPEFLELAEEMDVFGVCETWLTDKDKISLPGFSFIPKNRASGEIGPTKGGIGLFIKTEIRKFVKIREEISDENFLWCKIDKEFLGYQEDLYLCMVYIPPEESTREKRINTNHFETLLKRTAKIRSENIVLIGDFNSRTSDLNDVIYREKYDEAIQDFYPRVINPKRSNQDIVMNNHGKKLVEFCTASGCFIANGRTLGDFQGNLTCHEYNGSSAVDYGVISHSLQCNLRLFQVLLSTVGSDHCPIKIELRKGCKRKGPSKLDPKPRSIRWNEKSKLMFSKRMSNGKISQKISEIDNLIIENPSGIDSIAEKLSEIYVPKLGKKEQMKNKSRKKKVQKQWYDDSCSQLSRKLKETTKLLAKSPKNPHFRSNFCKTRKEYNKLLKQKKNEWKKNMIRNLEKLEEKDPKEYWKMVNELREKKSNGASFDVDNFTAFFEKLYSSTGKVNIEVTNTVKEVMEKLEKFTDKPNFTLKELKKAIILLKNNRAAGPDRIPAEMLKASPDSVLETVLKVMNLIKSTFRFPEKWAIGLTSLIHKEGVDDDPDNYRAITVTNALAKVFTILVNERLEIWAKENNIQRKEQIGFEKKSRPSDHLFVLKSLIDSYTNQGKKLFTCFVDFQKAFDSVWREALFYKLLKCGMDPGYVKLIKIMYNQTYQSLKMNDGLGRTFKTSRGVRQGCILSPRLFNLFINDLPEIFEQDNCDPVSLANDLKINCLLYADDLVILSETPQGLQKCLDKLNAYTEQWDLKINTKKTKILIFQKKGRKSTVKFFIGHQTIEQTNTYKYLGTIITDTGNFRLNENNLKRKGLRASFIISKNIGPFSKPSTSIRIFEKVIEPILLYNCEVTGICVPQSWDYKKFTVRLWEIGIELERVALGFVRQLLGIHKKTSNIAIQTETGKYPICLKIFERAIKYWLRINSSERPMLKAALKKDIESFEGNKTCWIKSINFLRKVANVEGMPLNTNSEKAKLVIKYKQNLKKLYLNWWEEQKTENPKLDFYFKHKKVFRYEKYLDELPKNIRCHLTRLRLSSHCLPVEVLRYVKKKKKKILRVDRKCTICNLNQMGDEYHYLLDCKNSEIDHIRKVFFENIRVKIPQFEIFENNQILDYCLSMADSTTFLPFAIYVKDVLEMYREEKIDPRDNENAVVITKSGRESKRPSRLDL